MKISEVIQEFLPCEICGNNDLKNFYFHVLVDKGLQPYVKCCNCEEEYYSIKAKNILSGIKKSSQVKTGPKVENKIDLGLTNKETLHPLVKVLAKM